MNTIIAILFYICIILLPLNSRAYDGSDNLLLYNKRGFSVFVKSSELIKENVINGGKRGIYKKCYVSVNGNVLLKVNGRGFVDYPYMAISDLTQYLAFKVGENVKIWKIMLTVPKLQEIGEISFWIPRGKKDYERSYPCKCFWVAGKRPLLFMQVCDTGLNEPVQYLYAPEDNIIYARSNHLKVADGKGQISKNIVIDPSLFHAFNENLDE